MRKARVPLVTDSGLLVVFSIFYMALKILWWFEFVMPLIGSLSDCLGPQMLALFE